MLKNRNHLLYLLGLVAPLSYAFFSQYVQGFHPCELCIWQRWAYGAAILLALAGFYKNAAFKLSVLATAVICAIAVYHTGIEQKWWEGFSTCSSSFSAGSLEDLKNQILNAPSIRCDEATWFLFGLSMANWNAIYTFCLTVFGVRAICRQKSI
jgi:disulfide bond formation protein DsbB